MPPRSTNVAESILAAGRADATAVLYGDRVLTHGELRTAAYGWTTHLFRCGLANGDRIGIFSENSPLFIAAYLGVIRAGLCAVPFQIDCSDAALKQIVTFTAMRQIIVSQRFLERVRPTAEELGVELLAEPTALSEPQPPLPNLDPRHDLAAVMFTSGSTGEPKGVMVTHRNIQSNTDDILHYMRFTPQDRVMTVLPFYYCYGTSLLHTMLAAGGSLVINNRFMFPEKVLDELEQKQCTGLAGVPSTYQILLRKSSFARRKFPALRWFQQAGGRLPNTFIREIRQAFPDVKLFVMYGQTEATARLSYLPPERLGDKLGSIGSIGNNLPGTCLEVLKRDGTPVCPGSEEIGEIVATGDNITRGYWDDPEETSRYFRDGKLYTGDMARVDSDGFIFIVERTRDFIKSMGNRISPKEVEDVLGEMPEVAEAAVVGTPDDIWGEAVRAFIVTVRPGQLTAGEVHAYCLKRLPNYKIPQYIEFLTRLPKTAAGKVDKERLKNNPV